MKLTLRDVAFLAGVPAVTGPPGSGLVARWEADGITGLNDGDPVSSWPDQSGSGKTATGSGSTRPLFKTNIFGSKPAVRFDGTDDELVFTPESLTAWSLFLVWKVTTRQQYSGPISWRGSGKAGFVIWDSADSSGYDMACMVTDATNAETSLKYGANRHSLPSAACLDSIRSHAAVGPAPQWRFYGDGLGVGGFGLNSYGAIQTLATLGRAGFAGFDNCGCDLGAVLVYNSSLSDADRDAVVTWLNAKYAVF